MGFIFVTELQTVAPMDSRKLAMLCRELAENKKAENLLILDMRKLSAITDYFVLASATSEPHLRAVTEEIRDKLKEEHGLRPRVVDGAGYTSWVVLDYFDVIVHVMRAEVRARYDLETLWGDAPRVRTRGAAEARPKTRGRSGRG
jgi:ribosome-associated protein